MNLKRTAIAALAALSAASASAEIVIDTFDTPQTRGSSAVSLPPEQSAFANRSLDATFGFNIRNESKLEVAMISDETGILEWSNLRTGFSFDNLRFDGFTPIVMLGTYDVKIDGVSIGSGLMTDAFLETSPATISPGQTLRIEFRANGSVLGFSSDALVPVPEPATATLLTLGLLALHRRR